METNTFNIFFLCLLSYEMSKFEDSRRTIVLILREEFPIKYDVSYGWNIKANFFIEKEVTSMVVRLTRKIRCNLINFQSILVSPEGIIGLQKHKENKCQ